MREDALQVDLTRELSYKTTLRPTGHPFRAHFSPLTARMSDQTGQDSLQSLSNRPNDFYLMQDGSLHRCFQDNLLLTSTV